MTTQNTPDRFSIQVADGRSIEVLAAGPAVGVPLVFHTGTPGGLVAFQPMIEAVAGRGLRLVMYSRPGYGNSDPAPGRLVADAAGDVEAILDHLGAPDFATAGWSGGGPHALASAALLPGRCRAVAAIASVAPYHADGLDWLAGMAQENIAEFGAAVQGEAAIAALLGPAAELIAAVTAAQVAVAFGGLVSATDLAALTGEYAAFSAESLRAAVSTGIAGWRDDDLAFVRDWGFSLDELGARLPVSIWQGDQDSMVPFAHGRWLAGRLPRARAHLLPGEGHLTIGVSRLGGILDELVQDAGLAGYPIPASG
jgi:pimeloyl-ACP methyl ester carboxylesterase